MELGDPQQIKIYKRYNDYHADPEDVCECADIVQLDYEDYRIAIVSEECNAMGVIEAAIALSRSELRYLFEHGNLFWDISTLVTTERSLIVAMVDLAPEDLNAEARLVKHGVKFSEPSFNVGVVDGRISALLLEFGGNGTSTEMIDPMEDSAIDSTVYVSHRGREIIKNFSKSLRPHMILSSREDAGQWAIYEKVR